MNIKDVKNKRIYENTEAVSLRIKKETKALIKKHDINLRLLIEKAVEELNLK